LNIALAQRKFNMTRASDRRRSLLSFDDDRHARMIAGLKATARQRVLRWLPDEDQWDEPMTFGEFCVREFPRIAAGTHYFVVVLDDPPRKIIPYMYLIEPGGRIGNKEVGVLPPPESIAALRRALKPSRVRNREPRAQ
jgi:hypothetical protein